MQTVWSLSIWYVYYQLMTLTGLLLIRHKREQK